MSYLAIDTRSPSNSSSNFDLEVGLYKYQTLCLHLIATVEYLLPRRSKQPTSSYYNNNNWLPSIEYLLVPKSPYNCQSISWDALKNDNLLDILKSKYSALSNDNFSNPNISISGVGYLSNIIKESFELLRKPISVTSLSNTSSDINNGSNNSTLVLIPDVNLLGFQQHRDYNHNGTLELLMNQFKDKVYEILIEHTILKRQYMQSELIVHVIVVVVSKPPGVYLPENELERLRTLFPSLMHLSSNDDINENTNNNTENSYRSNRTNENPATIDISFSFIPNTTLNLDGKWKHYLQAVISPLPMKFNFPKIGSESSSIWCQLQGTSIHSVSALHTSLCAPDIIGTIHRDQLCPTSLQGQILIVSSLESQKIGLVEATTAFKTNNSRLGNAASFEAMLEVMSKKNLLLLFRVKAPQSHDDDYHNNYNNNTYNGDSSSSSVSSINQHSVWQHWALVPPYLPSNASINTTIGSSSAGIVRLLEKEEILFDRLAHFPTGSHRMANMDEAIADELPYFDEAFNKLRDQSPYDPIAYSSGKIEVLQNCIESFGQTRPPTRRSSSNEESNSLRFGTSPKNTAENVTSHHVGLPYAVASKSSPSQAVSRNETGRKTTRTSTTSATRGKARAPRGRAKGRGRGGRSRSKDKEPQVQQVQPVPPADSGKEAVDDELSEILEDHFGPSAYRPLLQPATFNQVNHFTTKHPEPRALNSHRLHSSQSLQISSWWDDDDL